MIVIDASILGNALADDTADGDETRVRLLTDPELHALDVEVLSVLRRHLNAGTLDDRWAGLAMDDLAEVPLPGGGPVASVPTTTTSPATTLPRRALRTTRLPLRHHRPEAGRSPMPDVPGRATLPTRVPVGQLTSTILTIFTSASVIVVRIATIAAA